MWGSRLMTATGAMSRMRLKLSLSPEQSAAQPAAWQRSRPDVRTCGGKRPLASPSEISATLSFRLDARRLDNRPPFLSLGLVESMKRFRGLLVGWKYLLADVGEPFAYRRVGERVDHRGIELHHDLLRRALGNPRPVPE